MICSMLARSAENGCFIKPLPDRDGNSAWINVVANFNMTWKAACMEILQYVRFILSSIQIAYLT